MNHLIFQFSLVLSIISISEVYCQSTKHYNVENAIALSGYDVVSYYQGKPLKGNKSIQVQYQSVYYQFYTKENLQLFLKNPTQYLPVYGGWCAYAMGSSGEKVEVNPMTYKIVNGKLYLFYNSFFNNTLTDWNKDELDLKKRADKNWLKIIQ